MPKLLTGCILESKKTKVYNHWPKCIPPSCQTGCRYGKTCYKLKTKMENNPTKIISVFLDKLSHQDKILPILESHKFIDKRYLFTCVNHYANYHLIDLEELPLKPY